ncbi:hypothetical protein BC829DRAFT_417294 [Chytridium lagenaria]|nr:hypothetical protein BC829DRAFT_417294 [Chytridium lagenaria]
MSNPSLPPTHPSYASTTSLAFKGVPINTRRQLQIATANLVATNATNVLSLDGGFTINGIPVSMQYVLSAVTHADRQKVQQQKDGDSQPQAMNPNYQRSVGQQDPTLPNTNRRQGYNTPTASNVSADSLRGSPFSPAAYSRVASPQYVGDKGQCHPHNPLTPGLSNMAYQDQTASSMASSSSGGYQAASAGHSTNHVITNNASSRQQGTHPTQYTPNLNQTSAQIQTSATSQTLQPVNIPVLMAKHRSKPPQAQT